MLSKQHFTNPFCLFVVIYDNKCYTVPMKQFHIAALTDIGFTPREAQMYLTLLERGPSTVQEIARHAKLGRAGLYLTMDALLDKGFIQKRVVKGRAVLVASAITDIKDWVDRRNKDFARALPSLSALNKNQLKLPHIEFFSGSDGFRLLWQRLFASKCKEYCIITDAEHMLGFVNENYISGPIIQEKKRRGITSRQLIVRSEYAKKIIAKDAQENRQTRVLPHFHKVPMTTIIYGSTVALISPLRENLLVLVESESFAQSQKSLFEVLWENLPAK